MKYCRLNVVGYLAVVSCVIVVTACSHHPLSTFEAQQGPLPAYACAANDYLKRYDCSVPKLYQAAVVGDPDAQYALGYLYYYGIGVALNKGIADQWFMRAADQDQPLAKKALALIKDGSHVYSLHAHQQPKPYTPKKYTQPHHEVFKHSRSVPALNHQVPTEPLHQSLPNYGRSTPSRRMGPSHPLYHLKARDNDEQQTANHPATASRHAMHRPQVQSRWLNLDQLPLAHYLPSKYTLQVAAGSHLAQLKKSLVHFNLRQPIYYYRGQHDGHVIYRAIYGQYASYHAAKAARHHLPKAMLARGVWVKPFATVHQEQNAYL